jgi:hypothetical protein
MPKKIKKVSSKLATSQDDFFKTIWMKGIFALLFAVIFFLLSRLEIKWLTEIKNVLGLVIGTFW